MHRAVRTRCAAAVSVLLAHGADPRRENGSGSTPLHLAVQTTGRGGSGTVSAKEQQARIIHLDQSLFESRGREALGGPGPIANQIERLRTELRAARREFRAARSRWRAALTELAALPVSTPSIA